MNTCNQTLLLREKPNFEEALDFIFRVYRGKKKTQGGAEDVEMDFEEEEAGDGWEDDDVVDEDHYLSEAQMEIQKAQLE